MSKILVTGATGFVGREVCRYLRKQGHMIIGTTRDQSLQVGPENIPLYHVQEFNKDMDWYPALSGVDSVVHLAARVHQINDQSENPLSEYYRVNFNGTKTLAMAAAAAGVKRLVFLSSIKVNGELTRGEPFSENDEPAPIDVTVFQNGRQKKFTDIAADHGIDCHTSSHSFTAPMLVEILPYLQGRYKKMAVASKCDCNSRSLVYVGNLVSAISTCLDHPDAAGKSFL